MTAAEGAAVPRVAIFDLDGTLVDSPRAIVETFTAVFETTGAPVADPADIRATIGMPLGQAFAKLMGLAADDDRVAEAVGQYQIAFRRIVLPRAEQLLFPGVADGLAALRDRGLALAVATSKFHASADALLGAARVRDLFDVLLGADQVTHPKPHPEMGLAVLKELGATVENAVMVGDTTHDLLMAKDAGMRSVAVTYGVHSREQLLSATPTWTADSFDEVLACLAEGLPAQ
jgi:phosphoglycolate phosphatase